MIESSVAIVPLWPHTHSWGSDRDVTVLPLESGTKLDSSSKVSEKLRRVDKPIVAFSNWSSNSDSDHLKHDVTLNSPSIAELFSRSNGEVTEGHPPKFQDQTMY